MLVGVLSLLAVSQVVGEPVRMPSFSVFDWWILVFLGVVGGAIQFAAYIWALGRISPATAGISLTLAPISAFIFAWPILGEAISIQAIIGLVLVVGSIVIMNRQPH